VATYPVPDPDLPRATPAVRVVAPLRPFTWLARGWGDLRAAPGPSLLHGVLAAVGGLLLLGWARSRWLLLPGAFSGFLLVGPILATGLYELSRRRAQGQRPRLAHALGAWTVASGPLVVVGVLLLGSATAWVLFSALLFHIFVPVPIDGPLAFLHYVLVHQGTLLFELWLLAGALGAASASCASLEMEP